jgi:thiol-disulfide isomerase/thioredoxin
LPYNHFLIQTASSQTDMTDSVTPDPPDALLFMTSSCPHCPTVLQGLGALIKAGRIARFEVINLALRPEAGAAFGVRTVPWIRIGDFVLEGLHTQAELQHWAGLAGTADGMATYLAETLKKGNLQRVTAMVKEDGARLDALLGLLTRPDTELHVRLGIGAVMEELEGNDILIRRLGSLTALARHADARVRHDACHYLSLTRSPQAIPVLQTLLRDSDAEVRATAGESLAALEQAGGK